MVPRSWWVRIETGTSARSSTPSVRTPRDCSHERSAPLTTVSTTSLTVPPKASLTALKSASSLRTTRKRRCGPISTLSGVGGAGFSPAHATSPRPSTASRAERSASTGRVASDAAAAAVRTPVRSRSSVPEASTFAPEGVRAGSHASSGCGTSAGTGPRSKRTWAMSTPAIPSMSA